MSSKENIDLERELELVKKNLFLAYRLVHSLKEIKEKEWEKLEQLLNVKPEPKAHGHYLWKSIKKEPPPDGVTCILGWMDSAYGSDILGDVVYRKSTTSGPVWCKSSTHDVLSFGALGEPTHWCHAPTPPKRAMQIAG